MNKAHEEARARVWRHAFFVVAVIAVPAVYCAVTAQVAFERSKSLEFCASCHVMTPYVEGLKDADSDMLAAKHYQNKRINKDQCYTCHADYDLFGPAKAKLNGLKHVTHYYFGKERPIKLYKPFPNSHCLQCHEGGKSFTASQTHQDMMDGLKSGETSCIDCHGPVHPSHAGGAK